MRGGSVSKARNWRSSGRGFESTEAAWKLWKFPLQNFASVFRKMLKSVASLYLESMPGEVKYPTKGVNVQPVVDSTFYLVNNVYTTLIKNSVMVKGKGYVRLRKCASYFRWRKPLWHCIRCREAFYEEKVKQQQRTLEDLMDEKCKLLAIQNELQQLHDTLPQAVSNFKVMPSVVTYYSTWNLIIRIPGLKYTAISSNVVENAGIWAYL